MQRFLMALTTSTQRKHLYHFTDRRNLSSIAEHGLLSLRELRRRGIMVDAPGGNQWSHDADTRLQLDRYVHLCFFDQHPMEYTARSDGRIGASIFLHVLSKVLDREGVLFCDEVSNKAGAVVRPLQEIDYYLDHEVIYTRTNWKDQAVQDRLRAARKWEILIPDHVPVDFLRKP
jgi:hypothetical protein